MLFNLENHLKIHVHHLFFDELTYADLARAAGFFQSIIQNEEDQLIGLKMTSPFLSFAAQLGAMAAGKTSVLISSLETEESLKKQQLQVPFKEIYTDECFKSLVKGRALSSNEIPENFPAVIVFSSGSSGTPNGIVLTFANLFFSARGFADFFQQTEKDRSLMNLPHHHVGGLMTLWRTFLSGGSLISSADKGPFDFISVVPLQLARALKNEDELARLKKCRVILVGGAKLTPELRQAAVRHNLSLFETYGMSETTSLVCAEGKVLPYREVALDSNGHFLIKGKTLSPGFYREGHFQALPLTSEGYYKTKDLGICTDGRFEFVRRDDLIFISGGENINPLTIEECLRTHPDILDAYVLPVDDPECWGQTGVCLFEAKVSLNEQVLRDFLKTKLHPYQIPKYFLPTTLQFPGQLKPKRSELQKIANDYFLKSLFAHTFREKSGAPVLVFFHGFTGKKEDFFELGESFRKDFSLLFIDLPGHGETKAKSFASTGDVLAKLARFLKLFSEKPFIFYGYSMGGRVALQLSLHHLQAQTLILESAGLGLPSAAEALERKDKDLLLFDGFSSTKEFLHHWYSNELFKNYRASQSFIEDIETKSHHELNEWRESQKTLSQGLFPLRDENLKALKKASCPVYYLYGSEDLKYKAYAPYFENSFEMKGASHNPHKTHPNEITAILKTILK